jgi:hypothetical protein
MNHMHKKVSSSRPPRRVKMEKTTQLTTKPPTTTLALFPNQPSFHPPLLPPKRTILPRSLPPSEAPAASPSPRLKRQPPATSQLPQIAFPTELLIAWVFLPPVPLQINRRSLPMWPSVLRTSILVYSQLLTVSTRLLRLKHKISPQQVIWGSLTYQTSFFRLLVQSR